MELCVETSSDTHIRIYMHTYHMHMQVKVHRGALCRNEQCVARIIALGQHASNMVARQV
jgi:hypothetical protein